MWIRSMIEFSPNLAVPLISQIRNRRNNMFKSRIFSYTLFFSITLVGPGENLVSPSAWKESIKQFSFLKLDPIKVDGKKNKDGVCRIEL
jgi:hypothetical protein